VASPSIRRIKKRCGRKAQDVIQKTLGKLEMAAYAIGMINLAKFMWVQAIMTGHRYGRLEGLRVS